MFVAILNEPQKGICVRPDAYILEKENYLISPVCLQTTLGNTNNKSSRRQRLNYLSRRFCDFLRMTATKICWLMTVELQINLAWARSDALVDQCWRAARGRHASITRTAVTLYSGAPVTESLVGPVIRFNARIGSWKLANSCPGLTVSVVRSGKKASP